MIVNKIKHNGHIEISDIVNNERFSKVYIGYSLEDAKRQFKSDVHNHRILNLVDLVINNHDDRIKGE